MKRTAALKKHIERLKHDDPVIKKQAVQFFAYNRYPQSLQYLRDILRSENESALVRWSAYALALGGDQRSLPIIKDKILTRLPDNKETLEWLKISSEILYQNSSNSVVDLLSSSCADDIKEGLILSYAHRQKATPFVDAIKTISKYDDPNLQKWIALSLGNTPGIKCGEFLLEHLDNADYQVREYTCWALSHLQDTVSLTPLFEKLSDPSPRVREWAVKALCRFNKPEVIECVINQYYLEPDKLCREGIIRSLTPFNNTQITQQFVLEQLQDHSSKSDIPLLLALIDTIPTENTSDLWFGPLFEILRGANDQVVKHAIASLAIGSANKAEITLVKKMLTDKRFRILSSFVAETDPLLRDLLLDCTKATQVANTGSLFPDRPQVYQIPTVTLPIEQSLHNATVLGNVSFVSNINIVDGGKMATKSKQSIDNTQVSGRVLQKSNSDESVQEIKSSDVAQSVDQISAPDHALSLGKYSAKGAIAIVALVAIAVCYFVVQWLQTR